MARSYDIAILSQKVEQMEGSIKANDVIANPTGDTTADLTKVQIDGTKYKVSDVIANPTGDITNILNAIQIDNSKYKIDYPLIEPVTVTGSALSPLAFRIGNFVIISAYAYEYAANTAFVTVPEELRPSESISVGRAWMQSDSSGWGSKEFILDTSGNITCISAIYRGNCILMYMLPTAQESTRSTRKKSKKEEN